MKVSDYRDDPTQPETHDDVNPYQNRITINDSPSYSSSGKKRKITLAKKVDKSNGINDIKKSL